MTDTPPPIVILGSERSGSNLLRKLLGNHSAISAPRPVHFHNSFSAHLHHYGALAEPTNGALLFEDLLALANHPRSDWKLALPFDDLAARAPLRTFFDFVDGLHRTKASAENKLAYCCKDNDLQRYAFSILRQRPDARFLYLYRDPRDVIASWLRNPAFFHHPLDAAYTWLNDQREILSLRDAHAVAMHSIRYEDLIAKTEEVMTAALSFLSFAPEPACFATDQKSDQDATRVTFWKNLNQPILRDNFNKFRDQLAPAQLLAIETVCKSMMAPLGYELFTPANARLAGRKFQARTWWEKGQFRRKHHAAIARNTAEVLDKNLFVRRQIAARARRKPAL